MQLVFIALFLCIVYNKQYGYGKTQQESNCAFDPLGQFRHFDCHRYRNGNFNGPSASWRDPDYQSSGGAND